MNVLMFIIISTLVGIGTAMSFTYPYRNLYNIALSEVNTEQKINIPSDYYIPCLLYNLSYTEEELKNMGEEEDMDVI